MKIKKENCLIPVVVGCFMMLSYISMKLICRGKYNFIHIISERIALPPMWIFNSLYLVSLFLLGVGAGFCAKQILFEGCSIEAENLFYKGGVFFVAVYFLSILWYPVIFVLQMPIFSLFIALLCLVFVIATFIFWFRVSSVYSLFILSYVLWAAYLEILNLIIIFTI